MKIRQLSEGPCKTYLLASGSGEAVLIDPLLEKVEVYLDLLKGEGLRLKYVLDSHTHADHLSGCAALRDRSGADYLMHRAAPEACVSRRLEDGETVAAGDIRIRLMHTPGHTADSLTLDLGERVLTGDFLFIGSMGGGRLDLPGSDPAVHYASLKKLAGLADATVVAPAHDYQGFTESTMGAERRNNPLLQPRGLDAYLRWWQERKFSPAPWMLDVVKANSACTRDPRAVRIPKDEAACACVSAGPALAHEQGPVLSAADLARMLADQTPLFLLDVRTDEEFTGELGHIRGSVLIPVDELEGRLQEVPRAAAVVSICRSGKRAARAASMLRAAGAAKVWVLEGGMLAWNEAKLPLA